LNAEISAYAANTNFQLSPKVDQINSLMGGSSNANAQSLGVIFSLRYYLK
jgi:hypothetical protein